MRNVGPRYVRLFTVQGPHSPSRGAQGATMPTAAEAKAFRLQNSAVARMNAVRQKVASPAPSSQPANLPQYRSTPSEVKAWLRDRGYTQAQGLAIQRARTSATQRVQARRNTSRPCPPPPPPPQQSLAHSKSNASCASTIQGLRLCRLRRKFDCSAPPGTHEQPISPLAALFMPPSPPQPPLPPSPITQCGRGRCMCPCGATVVDLRTMRLPFRWMHIPKTGTSFANNIVHIACLAANNATHLLPPWAEMRVLASYLKEAGGDPGGSLPHYFSSCFPRIVPGRCAFTTASWAAMTDHVPIAAAEVHTMRVAARYVTIVRKPLSRLISAFNYFRRPTASDNRTSLHGALVAFVRGNNFGRPKWTTPAGCAAKMLIGLHCEGIYPSASERSVAVDRLSAFSFVGLMERWELSVCVARLAFGGHMLPLELHNIRRGGATTDDEADQLRALINARIEDPADEAVYAHAEKLLDAQAARLMGSASEGAALKRRCAAPPVAAERLPK